MLAASAPWSRPRGGLARESGSIVAFRPCVSCGARYFGGSEYSYVTWWSGEEKLNYRLQHCSSCAAELRNGVLQVADRRLESGEWEAVNELMPLEVESAKVLSSPIKRKASA